jgi:hypothetical protein
LLYRCLDRNGHEHTPLFWRYSNAVFLLLYNSISLLNPAYSLIQITYTWTFRSFRLAVGACGIMSTEMAMRAATADATVVKYPKTFWPLTRRECIARFIGVGCWNCCSRDLTIQTRRFEDCPQTDLSSSKPRHYITKHNYCLVTISPYILSTRGIVKIPAHLHYLLPSSSPGNSLIMRKSRKPFR